MNSKLKTKNSKFNSALALLCVRASSRAYVTATDSEPSTDTQYLILELPDSGGVRTAGRAGSPPARDLSELPAASHQSHTTHKSSTPAAGTLAELKTKNSKLKTDSGLILVAFRGTSSLEDFLCDADFFTTRINLNTDARVHLGFYRAYKSIESRLKARLDEIITRRAVGSSTCNLQPATCTSIVFTGHSLGGALALLAAYYLSHFYNIEAVYTFGAPDVGNAAFTKSFNRRKQREQSGMVCGGSPPSCPSLPSVKIPLGEKIFCLANAGDPVTWLPPYRFGFRRAGKFFFLPGVTWMVPGFRAPQLARVMAGAIQVCQNWRHGKLALLSNHSLQLYKTRIEQLAAENGELSRTKN